MKADVASDICNRLQICALTLESIDESTDRSIVLQRRDNVLKQISVIGKLVHEQLPEPTDPNTHLVGEHA
jgi:hypothetical protein